ncbi:MAG: diguanylate cyclase [Pseudohongiellaceae bacterium]
MALDKKTNTPCELLRILLIEDNADDGEWTKQVLNEVYGIDGYSLTWLQSASDVLEVLRTFPFDVVLFDNYLGDEIGIELIQDIHCSMPTHPPMILLTSVDNKMVDLGASSAGACDYLVKQNLTAAALERSIRFATHRKSFEEELLQVAHYDHLTGVANRKLFELTLENSLNQANRTGTKVGLILIDLDKFKPVNDTYGHPIGDKLLREVGARISSMIRQSDFIARIGGDEFCIIASHLVDPKNIAPLVAAVIGKLSEPFVLGDVTVKISASAGVAVYPNDSNAAEAIIEAADKALYRAKQHEAGSFNFYDAELNPIFALAKPSLSLASARQGTSAL